MLGPGTHSVSTLLTHGLQALWCLGRSGGSQMRVLVKKWGNSASVRIPASVMATAKIDFDQPVDVREEEGRIVVESIRQPKYELAELIGGITAENRHDEIDFGAPVGKEPA